MTEMKTCKTCNVEKELIMFRNKKSKTKKGIKHYHNKSCKKCECNNNRGNRKKYSTTSKGRYAASKWSAKKRKKTFELTKEDYEKLTNNQKCIYCGGTDGTGNNKYVGVDRVCNDIGYKIGNVVPCCRCCNVMKGTMSYIQFINICNRIAKKHNNKF